MYTVSLFQFLVFEKKLNFLIVVPCLSNIITFVLLRFNSKPRLLLYCCNIDIHFCKSSFESEKIAKSSANSKLFILVSSRYGMSLIVSGDRLSTSNRLGKSFIAFSRSKIPCFYHSFTGKEIFCVFNKRW